MQNCKAWIAASAAVIALAMAGTASARVMTVTATGVIGGGDAEFGIFGPIGSSLAGSPYSVSVTYDTSLGAAATHAGISDDRSGGVTSGVTSPITAASFTTNGTTFDFDLSHADTDVFTRADRIVDSIEAEQTIGGFVFFASFSCSWKSTTLRRC